jgi:hypothetical protein
MQLQAVRQANGALGVRDGDTTVHFTSRPQRRISFSRRMKKKRESTTSRRGKVVAALTLTSFIAVPAIILLVTAPGCTSVEDGAKDEFSETYTCPPERVEVRKRSDLKATDVEGHSAAGQPPAEIAADPGRLQMWQKEQREKDDNENSYHTVVEARGCDHQVLYTCGHTTGKSSKPWLCMERKYPQGVSKW